MRFRDKASARRHVWDALESAHAARFPYPPHGRIPNFEGAARAAERLLATPPLARAEIVKVNPDAPQRPLRQALLERGSVVLMPTPRLRGGFLCLDPRRIPARQRRRAASLSGARAFAREVPLDALPEIDCIVCGSVAVTRRGRRAGKGEGYSDLEYAILRELGHPPLPVLTSVHPLQVLEEIPRDRQDLPLSWIATPEETIRVRRPPAPPRGIAWSKLPPEALEAMPVLRELHELRPRRRG